MKRKIIDDNSISLITEEPDDLLILRRIIKKGDKIIGDTTRQIKQEKDYSRPDKGERIKIKISLNVEKISLDNVLDRLRINGTIEDSNSELVPHGSHHSFLVKFNHGFILTKKSWGTFEKQLIESKNKNFGFLLISIDTESCGIGRINGTHLKVMPNIYSGSSGKQYKTTFKIEKFFDEIIKAVIPSIEEKDSIIIFGPGETKKRFFNVLEKTLMQKYKILVVDGIDSGGEDGIYIFTKSQSMKEIMSESKLAKVSLIVDSVMYLANKKSKKFTMGFNETEKANQFGAIESLVFSEKILQLEDEEKIITFLNEVEKKGTRIYSVDSTTDIGLRISSLGGIISLLRFPIEG